MCQIARFPWKDEKCNLIALRCVNEQWHVLVTIFSHCRCRTFRMQVLIMSYQESQTVQIVQFVQYLSSLFVLGKGFWGTVLPLLFELTVGVDYSLALPTDLQSRTLVYSVLSWAC